jgi:hypothetical protein
VARSRLLSVIVALSCWRAVPQQSHAAGSRPWLPRGRRVRDGDDAVWVFYDYSQQYLTLGSVFVGLAAVRGHARRHRGAVHRGARMGRGLLGRSRHAFAAREMPSQSACSAAEGVGSRAGLQRAARDGDRDARRARAARLPGLRSAGDRQQHAGRGGVAPGRGALRRARAALPLLPRAPLEGLQGGRAELRAARRPRPTPK